jgi:hypothetical protein
MERNRAPGELGYRHIEHRGLTAENSSGSVILSGHLLVMEKDVSASATSPGSTISFARVCLAWVKINTTIPIDETRRLARFCSFLLVPNLCGLMISSKIDKVQHTGRPPQDMLRMLTVLGGHATI